MLTSLQQILWRSWQRLEEQILVLLPGILAMLLILAVGWVVARIVQWALQRMSTRLESGLRRWGVSMVMDSYGGGCGSRFVARVAFWVVFASAVLMGINALNTQLGSLLVTNAFLYLPRLVTAGFIIVAGLLLARYLARGSLIWAVNEGIGPARWIAGGVRLGVGLLTFVAATEQLGLAQTAILATFVILLSGTVLAAALAIGLGSRRRVEQWLDRRAAFLSETKDEERIEHV